MMLVPKVGVVMAEPPAVQVTFVTYVVYNSPYWRLRVGNFKTNEEAQTAAEELRMAFPSYAREIRVVRDRIVVDAE